MGVQRAGKAGSVIAIAVMGIGAIALLLMAKQMTERAGRAMTSRPSPDAAVTAGDWYLRGDDLLKRAKDLRGASDAYRKAVELAPEMGEAHFGLGYSLLELGDFDGAIAELESALSLANENAVWRKDAEQALVLAHLRKSRAATR